MRNPRVPEPDDLILRDVLAIDRTVLANERTLLAYVRTVLALLAAGGSVIHFVEAWWALPVGVLLLLAAPLALTIGVWRFRRVNRDLRRVRQGNVDAPVRPESPNWRDG
jgi:inner membrane protein YidH